MLPDRRISLEVTAAANEEIEALRKAAFGRPWKAPTLRANWWIGLPLDGKVMVNEVMANVVPHLEVLEKHGVEQIGGGSRLQRKPPPGAGEAVAGAAREVFGLRVRFAARLAPPHPGEDAQVFASLSGSVGSDLDSLNDLVARCARENPEKLAAAEGDERHLFVWIHSSRAAAELGIATLPPRPTAPSLPAVIDVVWVASSGAVGQPFGRLWRVRPPGGWEVLDGG